MTRRTPVSPGALSPTRTGIGSLSGTSTRSVTNMLYVSSVLFWGVLSIPLSQNLSSDGVFCLCFGCFWGFVFAFWFGLLFRILVFHYLYFFCVVILPIIFYPHYCFTYLYINFLFLPPRSPPPPFLWFFFWCVFCFNICFCFVFSLKLLESF